MPCALVRVKARSIPFGRVDKPGQRSPELIASLGRFRMNTLEKSVKKLAGALDALEEKLDDRISDLSAKTETIDQAKIRARTAKTQASAAAEDLADAIRDLKSLLTLEKGA